MIERKDGRLVQAAEGARSIILMPSRCGRRSASGQESRPVELKFGSQTLDYTIAAAETTQALNVAVEAGGETVVASQAVTLEPARKTDDLHPAALAQRHRLHGAPDRHGGEAGQQHAARAWPSPAARPTIRTGARFVWNVEVLWGADLYLRRLSPSSSARPSSPP